jgi:hypothetical protein
MKIGGSSENRRCEGGRSSLPDLIVRVLASPSQPTFNNSVEAPFMYRVQLSYIRVLLTLSVNISFKALGLRPQTPAEAPPRAGFNMISPVAYSQQSILARYKIVSITTGC